MTLIAFIGLGNMGGPMSVNLVKAGHTVSGFDLAPAACAAPRDAGVTIAAGASDAVTDADIIITMLPSGRHVVGLYGELLPAAKPGSLFIDCSTIDVAGARAAHGLAEAAGMVSVDAPVSGGVGGAAGGTLTFMAGGTEAAFVRAQPVLSAMGRKIIHCGDAGAGQAAKICNNMILGISMIAVSEGFVLAEKLGLSAQALFDVVSTSSGQCWSVSTYCPVPGPVPTSPANNGYRPGFATALMLKDLLLAKGAAEDAGADTPLGRHAADIYQAFDQSGGGAVDFSGIINDIRTRSDEQKGTH